MIEAILLAHAEIESIVEEWRAPYRDKSVRRVRSCVPQRIVSRIREVCKEIQGDKWPWPVIDRDAGTVDKIVRSVSTDEAIATLAPRRHGLFVLGPGVMRGMNAADVAITKLAE